LEAHEFRAIEVACALEGDQQLLYFVEGDGRVVGKAREMMRELIALPPLQYSIWGAENPLSPTRQGSDRSP
jgi:hypothetical protein